MSKLIKLLACVVLFGTAAACTPYAEMGFAGGFESNWLAPDVLSVYVAGNGYTSDQRIRDYSLLQAAERGEAAGYKYFTVVQNQNRGGTETYWTPQTSTTTGSVSGNTFNAQTTTSGGPETVYKPARGLVVRMYHDPPPGYVSGQYYDISELMTTLGARYHRPYATAHAQPPSASPAH